MLFRSDETSVTLYCGLLGIDSAGNAGPLSSFLYEMVLEFEVLDEIKAASNECKTIRDGCLPEWVFWVMIGCIALLLVVLLVVVICWCWSTMSTRKREANAAADDKKRKDTEKQEYISKPVTPAVAPSTAEPVSEPATNFPPRSIPIQNAFINEAYIQETNGTLRLIASNGQFLESNQIGRAHV